MTKIKLAFKGYIQKYVSFFQFALHPTVPAYQPLGPFQKAKKTLQLLDIKLFLAVSAALMVGLIYDPENISKTRMHELYSPLKLYFIGAIFLPLFEEIAFRLSMKFKPIYLALTLGVIGYYIVTKKVFHTRNSDIEHHFVARLLTIVLITGLSYSIFSFKLIKEKLAMFWEKNFRLIYYFSIVCFAWVHILNYELTLLHLLLIPFLTLPQLTAALCYGYIRINYGFLYSFGLHALWNSFAISMTLLSGPGGD